MSLFASNGYIILRNVLNDKLCDKAGRDIENFYKTGVGSRVVNLHISSEAVREMITSEEVYKWVKQNCFEEPTIYTTLSFLKGSQQPIHRDVPHFNTFPPYQFIGIWYAVEDATVENGCLEYIKGGHLVSDIDGVDLAVELFPKTDNLTKQQIDIVVNEYQERIVEDCIGLPRERGVLKKGDVLIWDAKLPHGGGKILNKNLTRKSIVAHCVTRGTEVFNAENFVGNELDVEMNNLFYDLGPNGWFIQHQPKPFFQNVYV